VNIAVALPALDLPISSHRIISSSDRRAGSR